MPYSRTEVDVSRRYLEEIVNRSSGKSCLLGGWAVHHLVDTEFRRETSREYIGSRDIDLGFEIGDDSSETELRKSDLAKLLSVLKDLGFWPLSFRFAKDFDLETGAELTAEEAAQRGAFETLQLYVDPIVDVVHPKFRDVFGFNPIDEPLLSHVFDDGRKMSLKVGGRSVYVPEVPVLIAMKLNSAPRRNRSHKRVKDILDIYALAWYTGVGPREIQRELSSFYPPRTVRRVIRGFTPDEIDEASTEIGIDAGQIRRVLLELSQS